MDMNRDEIVRCYILYTKLLHCHVSSHKSNTFTSTVSASSFYRYLHKVSEDCENIYKLESLKLMNKSIPSDFHRPLLDYEKHDMGAVVFDAYYMNSDKIKSDLNRAASHAEMFLK